jgi:hypothetical protein
MNPECEKYERIYTGHSRETDVVEIAVHLRSTQLFNTVQIAQRAQLEKIAMLFYEISELVASLVNFFFQL